MKTALVVMLVVVAYALVVTLAIPVFGPALDRAGLTELWVVGAILNSFLLFWSFVLFTGLALAAVFIVSFRILKVRCVAFRRDG